MKKVIIFITIIIVLSLCGCSVTESSPKYKYDFWVTYDEFSNAIENDLTLNDFNDVTFTANPKELFGDTFIPFTAIFPGENSADCEVQIFPEYGVYSYIVNNEYVLSESKKKSYITFTQTHIEKTKYPAGTSTLIDSNKVEKLDLDTLKKHGEVHVEGISNSVPYFRKYIFTDTSEKKDRSEYDIEHRLYLIYGDFKYEIFHLEKNAHLKREEYTFVSEPDRYIDSLTKYISDKYKNDSSKEEIKYDESKSFEEIYNAEVEKRKK